MTTVNLSMSESSQRYVFSIYPVFLISLWSVTSMTLWAKIPIVHLKNTPHFRSLSLKVKERANSVILTKTQSPLDSEKALSRSFWFLWESCDPNSSLQRSKAPYNNKHRVSSWMRGNSLNSAKLWSECLAVTKVSSCDDQARECWHARALKNSSRL